MDLPRIVLMAGILSASLSACSGQRLDIASARCSLSLPRGCEAERIDAPFFKTEEAYGLRFPGWDAVVEAEGPDSRVNDYPVYLSVYPGSISASGADYGWSFEEGRWRIAGREPGEASFSKGESFDLLRGSSIVSVVALESGETLSSETAPAFVAVLDGGKGKILVLTADPFFTDQAAFDAIVGGCVFR